MTPHFIFLSIVNKYLNVTLFLIIITLSIGVPIFLINILTTPPYSLRSRIASVDGGITGGCVNNESGFGPFLSSRWIVVTSISQPTQQIAKLSQIPGWQVWSWLTRRPQLAGPFATSSFWMSRHRSIWDMKFCTISRGTATPENGGLPLRHPTRGSIHLRHGR